ncbi:MAG: PTS system mannose/fructose/sorbose family transporter subunit IID [Anaerorhabdus sp.]
MSNENRMQEKKITNKDLRRSLHRYITARQAPFNYETMQSGGFVYAIHPILEKLYSDPEIIAEKERQYFKFYNTHPWMGNLILAVAIAVESTKDKDATTTAVDLRTALMGPLAGLGDAIVFIMPMTILGAIAAYMALQGSVVGFLIAESVALLIWAAFYKLFFVAHKQGVTFVTSRSKQLNNLTQAASIVGISIVGALVASTVSVHTGIQLNYGEVSQSLDDLLGTILPNLLNVLVVVGIYFGLNIKKMTSGKMVLIVIILSIILSAIGILG